MVLWQGEGRGEQSWFLVSELQVGRADREQPKAGRVGIAVLAAHAGDASGHAARQFAHGCRADRGEEFVTASEMPVGGVGHHAHHPGRFTKPHGVRATRPRQLQARGDEAVADGASGPPPRLGCLTC